MKDGKKTGFMRAQVKDRSISVREIFPCLPPGEGYGTAVFQAFLTYKNRWAGYTVGMHTPSISAYHMCASMKDSGLFNMEIDDSLGQYWVINFTVPHLPDGILAKTEGMDIFTDKPQLDKENCLILYLRERGEEGCIKELVNGLGIFDMNGFSGIDAPAYRISGVKRVLKERSEGIFLEKNPVEQKICGQVHRIYHVSKNGDIPLSAIDDDCAWVAGNGSKEDKGVLRIIFDYFVHIVVPLGFLSGALYAVTRVVASGWGFNISAAIIFSLAIAGIISFFLLVENIRRIFEYNPPMFSFGMGSLFNQLNSKDRSSLIHLADDVYNEREKEIRPSLVSTVKTIFSLKNAVLMAAGGLAVFIALGRLDWLILYGAAVAIFIPYLVATLYEFFCSDIDRYISRCEFIREYLDTNIFHYDLDRDTINFRKPFFLSRLWGDFTLKFPVFSGILSFVLVKLQVFVLGYLIGAAVVPFLDIETASLSLSDLLRSLSGILDWQWFNNSMQALAGLLNSSGLLLDIGEAVKLGTAVFGLWVLSLFRRTGPFFKTAFRNAVNFLPNLVHIWIAAVIIGGTSFSGLITDNARQITGANFPQAIHSYLGGEENTDVWSKAYLFCQQIKIDPESALQMEPGREELQLLLGEFKDKDECLNPDGAEVRRVCIFMLGQDEGRQAQEAVRSALDDSDNDTRLIAAISLSMNNNSRAISLLSDLKFENEGPAQQAALFSLHGAGSSEATEFIVKNLKYGSQAGIRLAAAETLSYRASMPEVTRVLLTTLQFDSSPAVRSQAAYSLAGVETEQVRDALVKALEDTDPMVKRAAILAVAPQADYSTRKLINSFLTDEDPSLRQAAVLSMGLNFNQSCMSSIYSKQILFDDSADVRSAAVSVLGAHINDFPDLVKTSFLRIIQDDSEPVEIRQDALLYLSQIDEPEIKSLLIDNLDNHDWQMRQSAALGLGNFEGDEIPGLLEPLTSDSSWQVREASAASLGNFDQPKIIGYLKPLLDDENREVRLAAVDAVGNFDDPKVVDLIAPRLNDSVWQIRESAAMALGKFDEPQTVEALIPLLKDTNAYVRQASALSLGDKVSTYPELPEEFINILKTDDDSVVKQISVFSLCAIDIPEVKEVEPLIRQNTAEVKVVVIIRGVDDGLGYFPWSSRDLEDTGFKNWPLVKILEAGGIKVIEHPWLGNLALPGNPVWSGNIIGKGFRAAQLSLDKTVNYALDLAKGGEILVIPYSGGNYVAERFLESDLSINVKEAFAAGKIHIISLGNPSTRNFGLLDTNWKNIWSKSDPVSRLSIGSSITGCDIEIPGLSHFPYKNSTVISFIGNEIGWRYTPTNGSWPGTYNFSSIAPADYYLQQGADLSDYWQQQLQQPSINISKYQVSPSDSFRMQSPINNYQIPQQYNLSVPQIQQPKIEIPRYQIPPADLFRMQSPINNYQPPTIPQTSIPNFSSQFNFK
ncbi:MAG: HEAT repeat domain-containing protein [Candidatus Omnitrophica bacterium]|nr:HEAT repeat domain-containing protein [Candidatus Omnitrophota bacterium]